MQFQKLNEMKMNLFFFLLIINGVILCTSFTFIIIVSKNILHIFECILKEYVKLKLNVKFLKQKIYSRFVLTTKNLK